MTWAGVAGGSIGSGVSKGEVALVGTMLWINPPVITVQTKDYGQCNVDFGSIGIGKFPSGLTVGAGIGMRGRT